MAPVSLETEAGGLQIKGPSELQNEFKDSLINLLWPCLKKGAGELAQQLKIPDALTEDPGSHSGTHKVACNHPTTPILGDLMSSSDFQGH